MSADVLRSTGRWERASTLIQLCKSLGEGRWPGTSAGTQRNAS